MLSITNLALELQDTCAWQSTPAPLDLTDYVGMVIRGIKRLFIDTGRALQYEEEKIVEIDEELFYDANIPIDEQRYILLCSIIEFFKKVQTDVNNITSYTTDALSVAGADKPYAHLRDTIEDYERQRRELYYRMVRFTLEYEV